MTTEIDQKKAETFAQEMMGALNGGMLSLMVSIGHQTGLFDVMVETGGSTSDQIARAARLDERYVREWLGAMVTGRVIRFEPTDGTYTLPAEHAAFLTRSAGPDNLGLIAQFIPMMAQVEGKVIDSFRSGGGVHYKNFENFHRLTAECSGSIQDQSLIGTIIPLVPGLVDRLGRGIQALDVGCGSGHAVNLMAKEFPRSRFTGYDFQEEAIGRARAEAESMGLDNARFDVRDVAMIEEVAAFDLITAFDSIHDQARPTEVLGRIARALRDDGTFYMIDVRASSHLEKNLDHPLGPFLYTISTMHCMTVSLALEGEGLGTVWGEEKALQMLRDAGFKKIDVKRIEKDVFNNYYIATKQ